jgi:hypothetical protein
VEPQPAAWGLGHVCGHSSGQSLPDLVTCELHCSSSLPPLWAPERSLEASVSGQASWVLVMK